MKTVYLAGPIRGLSYDGCNDWREYAKEKLKEWGIAGVSPMRAKEFLRTEKIMDDRHYDHVITCPTGITTRDRFDTTSCDILLANFLGAQKISIGTMIEYGWADSARKPIITVMEKEGNPHQHSMVEELTGFRVETLDEGLLVARAILHH